MTFNDDRDEENYYSANMIQVVLEGLDDYLEEFDLLYCITLRWLVVQNL